MTRKTILVIEDEPDIAELIQINLEEDGFEVICSNTAADGYRKIRLLIPDLVVLDLMLPDTPGIDLCKLIRQNKKFNQIPIIIATARASEADVVLGLEAGADDYITKPFSMRELSARIRAILRRNQRGQLINDSIIQSGPLRLDQLKHEAHINGNPLRLTLAEFRLLATLAGRAGEVLNRDQLLDSITEGSANIIDRNVDVHIRALRRKLGESGSLILTVRGIGYKFFA